MQKFVCNVTIDLKIMAAFLMTLLIGDLWGQHYPQVYFWALIALFSVGMALYLATDPKDIAYFVIGVIAMIIVGTALAVLIPWKVEVLRPLVMVMCLAPIYCPLWRQFVKICQKRYKKDQELNRH